MKKRKMLAPFLMLLSGAAASIAMFIMRYDFLEMLVILLLILIGFYIIGTVITWLLNRFDRQNEKAAAAEEGEVIEKDMTAEV